MSTLTVYPDLEQGEEWRPVPNFKGYEVSNLGRVRSYHAHGGNRGGRLLDTPRLKKTRRHGTGYLVVDLQEEIGRCRTHPVHVLVAGAFLGPRPRGHQVAHADGDRLNAGLANLRYATPLENAQDKHVHGTTARGEAAGRRKLTEACVREIVARYQQGVRQADLADLFGISTSQVSNIVRGASWSHLEVAR